MLLTFKENCFDKSFEAVFKCHVLQSQSCKNKYMIWLHDKDLTFLI